MPRPTARPRAAVLSLLLALVVLAGPGPAVAQEPITIRDESEPAGPSIELRRFEQVAPAGYLQARILKIDLADPDSDAELLTPGRVADAEGLSVMAARQGAIGGVNGDFFDISNTKAPLGVEIGESRLLKGPDPDRTLTAGIGEDGLGRIARTLLEGEVTLPGGARALGALNQANLSPDAIGVWNPLWGTASRTGATAGGLRVREVVVSNGVVTAVSDSATTTPIPADGFVVTGREDGGDALATVDVGDAVSVSYRPRTAALSGAGAGPPAWRFGLGGNVVLVEDGIVQPNGDPSRAPRTAVGFSVDGRTMWLAAMNGRLPSVPGPTLTEVARLMDSLGADDALNLDGGGSTTLLARERGETEPDIENIPSDGSERATPNGIGLFSEPGTALTGIAVEPAFEDPRANRVHAGLSRDLDAAGYDDNDAPVSVTGTTFGANRGSVSGEGIFRVPATARRGTASVQARAGGVTGDAELDVLGPADRLSASATRLSFADPGAAARTFTLYAHDDRGYAAPVEFEDIDATYDSSTIELEELSSGQIRVRPTGDGATVLVLTVPGAGGDPVTLRLAATVGSTQVSVSDFESLTPWAYATDRAPAGNLSLVPGRDAAAGNAIRITYDFTGSTATRGAYAAAITPILVDGQPQRFGLWVRGDGRGQLLRLQYTQANGTRANLDATMANQVFTGWRLIEFNVPAGVTYPLRIERIRVLETRASQSYAGSVDIDDLVAYVPRSLDLPEEELRTDPQILRQGPLAERRFRFATLSDVQFTANDTPNDRELIQVARDELREIKAEDPELLIINGDFVDTGFPADVRLAKQILDEELGNDLPYFYVPGNHEILGPGNLDAWRAEFGADHRTFDHRGIRFVLLNSSTGSLRGSNFEQLRTLRRALDEAATDRAVRGVMVFAHHPTEDPLSTDLSQLGDRLEVAMIERWLGEFRTETGKRAAMFGSHAQVVDVHRVDGVPYMVLPAAGKAAYGTPSRGGFNGRANFRVARGAGDAWLRSEVIATTQTVELEVPAFLDLGERGEVSATAVQPRSGARVPLRYPATARWSGDEHVFVGPTARARRARAEGFTVLLDPERGELLALRPSGRPVEISVTSDGVTATRPVRVTATVDCDAPDVIRGTAKRDLLRGTPGDDVICAGAGNDHILARGGDDVVLGEGGDDELSDGTGADTLLGHDGADLLRSLADGGADYLWCGAGRDRFALAAGDRANANCEVRIG